MTIDCNIIRDLLPSYVDKLTSDESNAAIEEHIKNCPACKEILENMKKAANGSETQTEEIDYLKKHKRNARKNTIVTAIILIALFAIVLVELLAHLIPLQGATKSDLNDYSLYPVMEVSLEQFEETADIDDNKAVYRIEWDGGNLLQKAVLEVVRETNGSTDQFATEQISAKCTGLFFRQAGSSVNTEDGVIYVRITGYRKTLFYTGKAEEFGFAIKINE